ncbi:phosphotransferase family protein [Amycolatopsis sp. NPDC059021]|uniref:phosphotransferase family protein n=1 Tax=Amycolatopsis sp. NPDC059021 TaxID=3346704 RepID=UPI00366B749D
MTSPEPAAVRRLLRRVLPGEPRISRVDEGGDHATWLVGTGHVLRMARDIDGTAGQRREIALREAIRPHLAIAVPRSVAHGEWAPGLGYTLDTRLPGISAEKQAVSAAGEEDLAVLLTGLRSVPAATVDVPAAAARSLPELTGEAVRAAVRLAEDGAAGPDLAHRLTGPLPPAAPATLLHHDLKGEHLLVTGAGRVSGVLDWTDAILGDPAEDVAGLVISVGAAAALRVARLAGHGPELCARALLLARCDTLTRLADRVYGTDDSPLPLLRAQLARAWETTPDLYRENPGRA